MAQGAFKKNNSQANQFRRKKQSAKPQTAFTRRANAPIQAKKTKFNEHQKIKQAVSKNLHKSMEKQIRTMAGNDQIQLSQAQKAVAKHHKTTS